MTVGEIIKQYREEHGMSQRDFAQASGLSNTYIMRLERGIQGRGADHAPKFGTLSQIAGAMGLEYNDLLGMIDDEVIVRSRPARPVIDGEAVTDDEEDLIRRYRDLSAAGRGRLRDYLDDLLQIYKNIASDGSLSDADGVG